MPSRRARGPSSRRRPTRVVTDEQNRVTGVEFQRMAPGRARRLRAAPPGAVAGHRVHHRLRPRAAGHRPGARPGLAGARRGRACGANKQRRLAADARDLRHRPAGRLRHRRRAHRRRHRGRGRGRGSPRGVRHRRLPQGPWTSRPSGRARRWPSRSPSSCPSCPTPSEVKEPRLRLKAMPAEVRNQSYVEYEIPYTQQEAMAESERCLQCTCEAIGYCDLRRQGIEYGTTLQTLEPARTGPVVPERVREPLHGHQPRLHPRRQPRLHPARAVALHRLRPLRQRLQGGRRRRLLRLHAHRLRHAGHDAARHEPQHHALRLLRPLRGDLPDRRPDAQAARPREVRGRREPLHPVRHLRRRLPLRRAALRPRLRARARQPRGADDRPHRHQRPWTATPRSATSAASATGWRAPRPPGGGIPAERLLPMLPSGVASERRRPPARRERPRRAAATAPLHAK